MFKNLRISIKILIVIIIMSLGSLIFVFGASYFIMNSMIDEFQNTNIKLGINSAEISETSLLEQMEDYLFKVVLKQAQAADNQLATVNKAVTECAEYTNSLYVNSSNFEGKDMPNPKDTEEGVFCSKYFLVKGVKETDAVREEVRILSNCEYMFGPVLKNSDIMSNVYLGTESGISYRYSPYNNYDPDYDPRKRDWYKAAMEKPDTLVWLPTYTDAFGDILITAAMTYRDADGNLAGVVASDIMLNSIVEDLMSLSIGKTGSCFILEPTLDFIAHKDMENEDFDYDIRNHFKGRVLFTMITSSAHGIAQDTYEGKDCYIAYSKMDETGWVFCASVEKGEVTAPAARAKQESNTLINKSQTEMQKRLFDIFKMFMVYFAIMGIAVVLISFAVAGTITRPIQKLASRVHGIGEGNLDQKIPVESHDEIGELAQRFNSMQDDLKAYIENIREVTAEKERIGTELEVAKSIQADMLPRIFPPFPGRKEFDIYASMSPAKEVGGDFYDFFFADEDHIALVIADVSGKGIPAALFMVVAKTMIKNHVQGSKSLSPSKILGRVNSKLCEGNEMEMFVTVWLAIIDLRTGKGVAANAGHEHPALRRANGDYEFVVYKHSMALGVMDGIPFREHEFQLYPGDSLFVYTDGATEATNKEFTLFGMDRLKDALNKDPEADPTVVLNNVIESIDLFVGEAPQFDDLTMLAIRYNGSESKTDQEES
ncbi:MAG: SpoIIE family protein phosphatase [Lachnospiraceae bacterium]